MGRSLRILHHLDTAHPGAAAKILMYAERIQKAETIPELFLKRNIIFERLRLFSRVFAENRLNAIQKLLVREEAHA